MMFKKGDLVKYEMSAIDEDRPRLNLGCVDPGSGEFQVSEVLEVAGTSFFVALRERLMRWRFQTEDKDLDGFPTLAIKEQTELTEEQREAKRALEKWLDD